MEIPCPNGYVHDLGKFTMARTVGIHAGTCNASDLCGIEPCKYRDESPEAIKRHVRAVLDCTDMSNGMQAEENRKSALYKKFHRKGLRVVK